MAVMALESPKVVRMQCVLEAAVVVGGGVLRIGFLEWVIARCWDR